jgi:hypothetical protein
MIPHVRQHYNTNFSTEKYHRFLKQLDAVVGTEIHFRVAETPVFLPSTLVASMQQTALDLIGQLNTPDYHAASTRALPVEFTVPNEDAHPTFVQVDFAITRDADGNFQPKLIELQGFPSLYAFQMVLAQTIQQSFELNDMQFLLGNLSEADYIRLLTQVIRGNHDPENVILMEIQPQTQKTLPDFLCTEQLTGVKAVCITELIKRGRKLFYKQDGKEIPIHRIYNRTIVDEFVRKGIKAQFDFRDELDMEWAGHPNWYFRWSKFSIPFLNHPAVPKAYFLNTLTTYPDELSNFVLKPLFSFAGNGVKVDMTKEDLDAIPAEQRKNYLLQEKVTYGGVIQTPDEPSKVEVRVMFLWIDKPIPVNTLARLSKGKMMGVDFNKNKEWVGSSCCFFET